MSAIDFVFILIIVVCALLAAIQGFIRVLFSRAAFFLGIAGAFFLNPMITVYFFPLIPFLLAARIAAFFVAFIIIFLIIKIIQSFIGGFFQGEILKGLDRALGFILGLVEGIIIVAVVLFVLQIQPFFDADALLAASYFYRIFTMLMFNLSAVKIENTALFKMPRGDAYV
jgi:membrane protein required for colicin V production